MTCKRDNHPLLIIAKRVCPPNCIVADERLRNLTRKRLATWRKICGHANSWRWAGFGTKGK